MIKAEADGLGIFFAQFGEERYECETGFLAFLHFVGDGVARLPKFVAFEVVDFKVNVHGHAGHKGGRGLRLNVEVAAHKGCVGRMVGFDDAGGDLDIAHH